MASNDQLSSRYIKTEPIDSNNSNDTVDSFINLIVQDYSKKETTFKIRKTKPLNKLAEVYCERNGLNKEIMIFLFDGVRIGNNDTPDSLGMENDDIIDVVYHQKGFISV
ncbi:small ubiquitin-related modifier 1-like [Rhizophagus clarus]|uniref:Small ubiquitin-related modifier 1-like n=1 Tax=Rhizophagus clarus TaxID=94130 RepID=A0A8H3KY46_9GLOM|nr:small ubiquitin-related modifier 1-like [Rhizophagus clarus]